ncbi:MAG TPA: efflux RND transporter periplasmic adaptor subunit [Novosphingobium sp.]
MSVSLVVTLAACGGTVPKSGDKPAKVEPVAHESELMKITLSAEAERRLGIVVAPAVTATRAGTLATFGEIVVPPPSSGGIPLSAATDLAALAANQARADGDVARTAAMARAAQLNLERAEALVHEEAGSARARDDALAAAASSRADLSVARRQRSLLGAAVGSLGRLGTLWVRVPVLAADLARIDRRAAAAIDALGPDAGTTVGQPVTAPPTANSAAGSVDLYFTVASRGLQLGQRVAVTLPIAGKADTGATVPAAAIIYDIHGGEWVYARLAPRTYERRRVQVARVDGATAILAAMPGDAREVVTAGAAELFGTEFGTK